MLRYKHLRLEQTKIDRAKKILKVKTETEALNKALDKVIQEDGEKLQKKVIMKRMMELRNRVGKIKEDSAEWVRLARKGRTMFHESGH
jgi:hypothetical protein